MPYTVGRRSTRLPLSWRDRSAHGVSPTTSVVTVWMTAGSSNLLGEMSVIGRCPNLKILPHPNMLPSLRLVRHRCGQGLKSNATSVLGGFALPSMCSMIPSLRGIVSPLHSETLQVEVRGVERRPFAKTRLNFALLSIGVVHGFTRRSHRQRFQLSAVPLIGWWY